jgi:hypothetical protein
MVRGDEKPEFFVWLARVSDDATERDRLTLFD